MILKAMERGNQTMLNLENLDNIAQKNREEEGEGDRKVKGS